MEEKYTLDMLPSESVSVKKQVYVQYDGQLQPVGQPWRRAYMNSESGRQAVQNELLEQQQNAIFAVWGDAPTVDESAQ